MNRLEALLGRKKEPQRATSDWLYNVWAQAVNGYGTTFPGQKTDPISTEFLPLANQALKANAVVSAIESVRISVFSEARFMFQSLRNGRPGDLFSTADLALLERPWQGGTTGDLLTRMLLDADLAGNSYHVKIDGELVRLQPNWVVILLQPRMRYDPNADELRPVGMKRVGYAYYEGGIESTAAVSVFDTSEVAHFAPYPDPTASYRGMSWMTPVVREIQADLAATTHKEAFYDNAATPNLAVSLKEGISPERFAEFVDLMDRQHKGAENAYKTLYTAGGADVTVIGQNMQQLDFKAVQGAGETRIAAAAGVHPVIVGLSEGMQGSSLNAGNYTAAKRRFADGTMRPLWRNAAGSLEDLIPPASDARLWYDVRDIAFLRDDEKDRAEIASLEAAMIRTLGDGGWVDDTILAAISGGYEWTNLKHTGLLPVQLQPPGTTSSEPTDAPSPA